MNKKKRLKKWNQNPQILVQLSPDDIINWKNDNIIDWRNDNDDGLSSNNNNEDEADKGPLQLAQAGVEVPISAEYEDDNKPSKLVFCLVNLWPTVHYDYSYGPQTWKSSKLYSRRCH